MTELVLLACGGSLAPGNFAYIMFRNRMYATAKHSVSVRTHLVGLLNS